MIPLAIINNFSTTETTVGRWSGVLRWVVDIAVVLLFLAAIFYTESK